MQVGARPTGCTAQTLLGTVAHAPPHVRQIRHGHIRSSATQACEARSEVRALDGCSAGTNVNNQDYGRVDEMIPLPTSVDHKPETGLQPTPILGIRRCHCACSRYVIYTVARAREGVGRTWGITVKDAPGAAGGCVMPGVRRTSGRPRAGDSPRCAAPRAGEPLEPSPGIPLWASDYPADMKVRGVAWVWCSAERVLW